MVIGVLQVDLLVNDAASLKDRIGEPHTIAVAEVDALDAHQRCVLGITTVSNDGRHTRTVLDTIIEKLRHDPRITLTDHRVEILTGQ